MYAEAGITQYLFFPYISQLPHGALPACALKSPAAHASHGPPSGPLYPASHAQLVFTPTELELAGHAGVGATLDGVLVLVFSVASAVCELRRTQQTTATKQTFAFMCHEAFVYTRTHNFVGDKCCNTSQCVFRAHAPPETRASSSIQLARAARGN